MAITFVSSEPDEEVFKLIQARFEIAVTELPETIDPATYSTSSMHPIRRRTNEMCLRSECLIGWETTNCSLRSVPLFTRPEIQTDSVVTVSLCEAGRGE